MDGVIDKCDLNLTCSFTEFETDADEWFDYHEDHIPQSAISNENTDEHEQMQSSTVNDDYLAEVSPKSDRKCKPRIRTNFPSGGRPSAIYRKTRRNNLRYMKKAAAGIPSKKPPVAPITEPKPFIFQTDIRIPIKKPPSPLKRLQKENLENKQNSTKLTLTVARTPNLRSKSRTRPITVMSAEEKENLEIAEIKKYKFRASKLQKNILENPFTVIHPEHKPIEQVPFHLETEERNKVWSGKKKPQPKTPPFKAQPVPGKILEAPQGIKPRPSPKTTQPKTPNFQPRPIIKKRKSPALKRKPFIANKVPHSGLRFYPIIARKNPTEAAPFSFHEKDQIRYQKKEEKIKQSLEDNSKIPKFKANALYVVEPFQPVLPHNTTKPEPYNFRSTSARRSRSMSREPSSERQPFKAQQIPQSFYHPFKPQKPTPAKIVAEPIPLHLEERMSKRKEFDLQVQMRKENCERLAKQKEEEQNQREEQEFRKNITFQANKVRKFKSSPVKKALFKPTIPKTPNWHRRSADSK